MTMMLAPYRFASGGGGGGGGLVLITDRNLLVSGFGSQTVSYLVSNTGIVQRGHNGVYNTLETWKLSGAASDYEIKVTEDPSGDGLTGGSAVGSWLGLGTTREWELTETVSGGALVATLTVEIRLAAPPNTVLSSATVTLTAISF